MAAKVFVYVSGDANRKAQFAEAVASVRAAGFDVINDDAPSMQDITSRITGLTQLIRADVVYFAPGWSRSVCSQFELSYCKYIGKRCVMKISELSEVAK